VNANICYAHEMVLHRIDVFKLCQEPFIDIRHLADLVDAVSPMECSRNGKDTLIRRIDKLFIDVLDKIVLQRKSEGQP